MKIYVELIMWEEIKRDCKYPEEDNNNNFIYGLNYTDFENEGDIYQVEWFKSEKQDEEFYALCRTENQLN
jgi:hypothetical protein